MNRIAIAAAALLISASALATDKCHGQPVTPTPEATRSGEGFSRNGYAEHFAVSALAGVWSAAQIEKESPLKAFGYAMVPGVLKELIDATQKNNHFSGRDLAFDALGAAVGVGVGRYLLIRSRGGTTTVALSVPLD